MSEQNARFLQTMHDRELAEMLAGEAKYGNTSATITTGTPQEDTMALIQKLLPQYGVDPQLVTSLVGAESSFNPRALSPKGAMGLGQLMPQTAKRFGVSNPYDPEDNLRGTMQYLSVLQKQFPGRPDLQLAAYNAGEGAVMNYKGIPPYPET